MHFYILILYCSKTISERICTGYSIDEEKGPVSSLNNLFDWYSAPHYFCTYAKEGGFTRILMNFFFRCLFDLKAEGYVRWLVLFMVQAAIQRIYREEWGLALLNKFNQTDIIIFPLLRDCLASYFWQHSLLTERTSSFSANSRHLFP